jgi:energy-coupling factor transporter ATP-binding protein EcfA2
MSGVVAEGLVKRFGDFTALAGVDFEVPEGELVGLLGPNGAGKTTTIRILSTLLPFEGGHATVGGFDIVQQPQLVRGIIGLTGQYAAVDDDLTGRENLVLVGRLGRLANRKTGKEKTRIEEEKKIVGSPEGGPRSSLLYLLFELFGTTTDVSKYVYLTDGAHFENLALYELVRRECDFIIASDAGEDGGYVFSDLANAIRKCRTDLGAEIDERADVERIAGENHEIELRCGGEQPVELRQ